jgi:hypothetical protein
MLQDSSGAPLVKFSIQQDKKLSTAGEALGLGPVDWEYATN